MKYNNFFEHIKYQNSSYLYKASASGCGEQKKIKRVTNFAGVLINMLLLLNRVSQAHCALILANQPINLLSGSVSAERYEYKIIGGDIIDEPLAAISKALQDNNEVNNIKNKINAKFNITSSFKKFHELYKKQYPDIYSLASEEMKKGIKKKTGLIINPDTIYFHHFNEAQNDRHSFTGWRHDNSFPVESRTVTECLFSNFPVDARDNVDVLDQMSGVYFDKANESSSFGEENEVFIKPSVLLSIVKETDFFNYYLNKLEVYWSSTIPEMVAIATLISGLSKIEEAPQMEYYLMAFSIKNDSQNIVKKYILDINGYKATDAVVLTHSLTEEIDLYLPRAEDKFYHFPDLAKMRYWLANECKNPEQRNIIAAHFSIYNRQNGNIFYGIDSWLESFANNCNKENIINKIWTARQAIEGELIDHLIIEQKDRAYSDADSLIKSNSEVRLDMIMRYLSIANMLLPNPITPLISLGMDIERLIDGDNEDERQQGLHAFYADGLNVVIMVVSSVFEAHMGFPIDKIPVRGKVGYRASITSEIRSEVGAEMTNLRIHEVQKIQFRSLQQVSKNVVRSERIKPVQKKIALSRQIHQKLKRLDIESYSNDYSKMSKADEYGIMSSINGEKFIEINNKFYKIKNADKKGYFLIGDENRLGVYYCFKRKDYVAIDLLNVKNQALAAVKFDPSAPRSPISIFWKLSPRVRYLIKKTNLHGVAADKIESHLVFDKASKIFKHQQTSKKYLKVEHFYYPVYEQPDGYVVSGLDENSNEKKIIRMFYSEHKPLEKLVSHKEHALETFATVTRGLSEPDLMVFPSLNEREVALLSDLQSMRFRDHYRLPLLEVSNEFLPEIAGDEISERLEQLGTVLIKLKPERCTIKKSIMFSEKTLREIRRKDIFVLKRITLTDKDDVGKSLLSEEPGYRLLTLKISLIKNGYTLKLNSAGIAEGKVAIAGNTHFIVKDINKGVITVKEIPANYVKTSTRTPSVVRNLYPGNTVTARVRLTQAFVEFENQLAQGLSAQRLPKSLRERYTDVLADMARKAVSSPSIEEYTQADSDFINSWLRDDIDAVDGQHLSAREEAAHMLTEYQNLNDYDGLAYRAVIFPEGVYRGIIQEGDVVADRGFMSASALSINSFDWLNSWTKNTVKIKGDMAIMILDKNVPKKIASTDFLVDHILVKPGTALRVYKIRQAVQKKYGPILLVGVGRGSDYSGLKDIFTGAPAKPAPTV